MSKIPSYAIVPEEEASRFVKFNHMFAWSRRLRTSNFQAPEPESKEATLAAKHPKHSLRILAVVLSLIAGLTLIWWTRLRKIGPNTGLPEPWSRESFQSLVVFGDSYTDEGRWESSKYPLSERANTMPPGWFPPVSNKTTAVGGYVWPRYVNWHTGANIYNYAVGGAVSSLKITANGRVGIKDYEIPVFANDLRYFEAGGEDIIDDDTPDQRKYKQGALNITKDNTVYSIWIGTNDLGAGGFLLEQQEKGYVLQDFIDSVMENLDTLYDLGARKIVLMNLIPLQLLPTYSDPAKGGRKWTRFFSQKPDLNGTEYHLKMQDMVHTSNQQFRSILKDAMHKGERFAGARVALFDTYSFFQNLYDHPDGHFNGTEPANVTESVHQTFRDGSVKQSNSPDSYLWFDELHPSEQTSRLLAQEFIEVVSGNSSYATYWPPVDKRTELEVPQQYQEAAKELGSLVPSDHQKILGRQKPVRRESIKV